MWTAWLLFFFSKHHVNKVYRTVPYSSSMTFQSPQQQLSVCDSMSLPQTVLPLSVVESDIPVYTDRKFPGSPVHVWVCCSTTALLLWLTHITLCWFTHTHTLSQRQSLVWTHFLLKVNHRETKGNTTSSRSVSSSNFPAVTPLRLVQSLLLLCLMISVRGFASPAGTFRSTGELAPWSR